MTEAPSKPFRIGDYTIRTFSDGLFETNIDVTVGVDKALTQKMAGKSLTEPVFLSVNAFLVEGRGMRALVDAGSGDTMGPALGKLPDNLRAAGVGLDAITHVLVTHIHPDHTNGLIDGKGEMWFPNAEIVVQEDEAKYWLDRDISQAAHERMRRNMINAQKSLAPYKHQTTRVRDGEFTSGVRAMKAPGHTPGHNVWVIEGGGDALMIWGDTVHMQFLQLERPDIAFIFDTDPAMAVASRQKVFDMACADRIKVAGMHLDFPGTGVLRKRGAGYEFEPA